MRIHVDFHLWLVRLGKLYSAFQIGPRIKVPETALVPF